MSAARGLAVSAPGKLMLSGEYAVLDGAPAVVAAVSVRAVVRAVDGTGGELPPEVVATRALAEARYGRIDGAFALDVSALRRGDRKLGLGSSAAAAAATAAFVAASRGASVEAERAKLLELALEGHRAVAPEGSGADVAASVLGGFVRVQRHGARVETRSIAWPEALVASVVWTGEPARTSDLVARVRAFEKRDRAGYASRMDALAEAAAAMAAAFERGDAAAVVTATRRHGDAMRALGEASGAPIVEARLAALAALADAHGGAAKPSGAGGGDVAVAFFRDSAAVVAFEDAARGAGFSPLALGLGAEGVQVD